MSGYAIRGDGRGWRAVDGPEDVLPGETYSTVQPALTEPSTSALRRMEIMRDLDALDAASVRAQRAVLVAQASGAAPDVADMARLADLEAQAKALRAALAALVE